MQKISAYILTYNEAEKIEAAGSSVLWADEVVVVDSFSTDRTAEIARSLAHASWSCRSTGLATCAIAPSRPALLAGYSGSTPTNAAPTQRAMKFLRFWRVRQRMRSTWCHGAVT